ncbi:HECT-domain-containing protein [Mycena rebaudengoi]|nr:HECT-domain-containing protein [Mycena rebaudengoi]
MFPMLGDEKRRKVNLGGRSGPSHATVIDEVKSLRNLRQHQKLQQDGALKIQALWRGVLCRRGFHSRLRIMFEHDVLGLTGLRCVALLAERDEEILQIWTTAVLSSGEDTLFILARGSHRVSWVVLIRKIAVTLLRSVSSTDHPALPDSHLRILNLLLLRANVTKYVGVDGDSILHSITTYVQRRDFHLSVSKCLQKIPVQSKNNPSLPLLTNIAIAPLDTFESTSPEYLESLTAFILHILTIPLLPNRLPISSLTVFSSKLPLSSLGLLNSSLSWLHPISPEASIHLIANLLAFTPPRYNKLGPESLESYLRILTALLNSLPPNSLEAHHSPNSWQQLDSDSDSELDAPNEVAPVEMDSRTAKRLQTLASSAHISSLLSLRDTPILMDFVIVLTSTWPSRKTDVMTVVAGSSSLYVSRLYQNYIRDSVLGQAGRESSFTDPAHAALIPPFVLLLELYTQALATMGDDEFFSTDGPAAASSASRNPLSIEDLISFSRQLLKVTWALYFRTERSAGEDRDWNRIRDKAVKCLLSIHARDSRRPFTPEGHWLGAGVKINLQAFVEVATHEEAQVALAEKSLSARELAYFSPRLGILNNIPFAIPFFTRAAIFQRFVASSQKAFRENNRAARHSHHSRAQLRIRRDHLAQDGFEQLQDVDLREKVSVTFIDKFGMEEGNAGHHGLYKEFFTAICKEVFDSEHGLWFSNEKHEIYPSPQAHARSTESLKWFKFVGRILGKAIYDGILIDFAFAGFFLAKWLGRQGFLDDLASLDPTLYKGLIFLKHYAGDVEDLCLNFTVDIDDASAPQTIELIPNGSNIPVTKENRLQYIYLISHFRLSRQIKPQSAAFFEGLSEIIDSRWLRMFNQQELQALLGGADSIIDVEDLKSHTEYAGGYKDADDPTIVAFWNVVRTFDEVQRRALLHFVTSCSRPPLLGFKDLRPNFQIHDMGGDDDHLPGSATCSNLLLLPRYKDEEVLREKVLSAIMSQSGF